MKIVHFYLFYHGFIVKTVKIVFSNLCLWDCKQPLCFSEPSVWINFYTRCGHALSSAPIPEFPFVEAVVLTFLILRFIKKLSLATRDLCEKNKKLKKGRIIRENSYPNLSLTYLSKFKFRYPAGFVYIYSFFYGLTSKGENIRLAQILFIFIYLLFMSIVFFIYTKSKKVCFRFWLGFYLFKNYKNKRCRQSAWS